MNISKIRTWLQRKSRKGNETKDKNQTMDSLCRKTYDVVQVII